VVEVPLEVDAIDGVDLRLRFGSCLVVALVPDIDAWICGSSRRPGEVLHRRGVNGVCRSSQRRSG
jgi:hypothetical protein